MERSWHNEAETACWKASVQWNEAWKAADVYKRQAQGQEKEISFQRTEEDKDQHHTETIYWTERSV